MPELAFEFRGANAAVWHSRAPRQMLEGPRGTGKTTSAMFLAREISELYPTRGLFIRKHYNEFAGTICPQFEEDVLGMDHPAVTGFGGERERRRYYRFPNGTDITLFGLDDGGKVLSGEYDWSVTFQAERCPERSMSDVLASVRRGRLPWGFWNLFDVNPSHPHHYLLRWVREGMPTFKSRFEDNPRAAKPDGTLTKWGHDYLHNVLMKIYSGAQALRMIRGEWRAEEGVIIDVWDDEVRVVKRAKNRELWLDLCVRKNPKLVERYVGACDWGWSDIGTFQVWALVRAGPKELVAYCVAEWYRRGKGVKWWAKTMLQARAEFGFTRVIADCADVGAIETFNDLLSAAAGTPGARLVVPCYKPRNSLEIGIGLLRQKVMEEGIFYCEGALRDVDEDLLREDKPTGLLSELATWTWYQDPHSGEIDRERPDPKKPKHAIDPVRYLLVDLHGRSNEEPAVERYSKVPKGVKLVPLEDGSFVVEHVESEDPTDNGEWMDRDVVTRDPRTWN